MRAQVCRTQQSTAQLCSDNLSSRPPHKHHTVGLMQSIAEASAGARREKISHVNVLILILILILVRNLKVIWEEAASPEPHSLYTTLRRPVFPSCPFPWEKAGPLSNAWYLGLTRPATSNSISIESAVFAKYTFVTNDRETDRQADRMNTELGLYQ